MVTTKGAELTEYEALRTARSFLEYVRRSSPSDAPATVSRDIEALLGKGKNRDVDRDPERWLVQYAIDFANGDTDRSEIRRLLKSGNASLDAPNGRRLATEQQLEIDAAATEARRGKWREFLAAVVRDPADAAARLLGDAEKLLERVWPLPALRRTPRGVALRYHAIILDLSSFDAFVSTLLLDEERPFGRDLCRCKFKGCGADGHGALFFLEKKPATGRPQRRYCTPEHMLMAHARESTKRARKSRAKRKAAMRRK
jgi:hypothetical protein